MIPYSAHQPLGECAPRPPAEVSSAPGQASRSPDCAMVLARATGDASPQTFATGTGSSHLHSSVILLAVVAGTLRCAYRAIYTPNLARTHELDHFSSLLAGFWVRLLDSHVFTSAIFHMHTHTHTHTYYQEVHTHRYIPSQPPPHSASCKVHPCVCACQ